MQPEILSFVDDLRALGMTDPPRKHWLFQPTVTVCRWQDPETGTVYGLRPPLPLATDQQWLSYGADFIDPLLRRHHGDQRLQLHSRLVQEVMAWRSAQPPELRVWREDPTAGPTDPLEWLYNENPWIAAELETVLVDREFWRGAHPTPPLPFLVGVWWTEAHPRASTEWWKHRQQEMRSYAEFHAEENGVRRYSFNRYLEHMDYLLAWRELVPADQRPWWTRSKELVLRRPGISFH
ncbi:hypothetical protein NLM31_36745 [Bradyrhizobium sp. CCGUVB4N]|uniref:hypothetical protein n=1 Tax=Bradyrhizobium sp. CCGUVB4N TaxID=2949631 RepID=UPI0020B1CD31|nr:hypothetical protein [Bradyrhizobium sp. CCGUVB4N]MCP3385951.1 hypothetical protein [Bradyrhizobium sp. CCGUVB4N]